MRLGSKLCGIGGDAGQPKAFFDGTGKESAAQSPYIFQFALRRERGDEVAPIGDVGTEFRYGSETLRACAAARQPGRKPLKKVFDIAEKQIVLVAIMRIKGRAADTGAVENLLHRNIFERFLADQLDERIAQGVACAKNTPVRFCSIGLPFDTVTGQWALLCSVSPRPGKTVSTRAAIFSTVPHMTDDRKSGIAFIAASIGGIVTMAIHPTASSGLAADQIEHLALVSAIAHSIAIISFLILFLGAVGLTHRLAGREDSDQPERLALIALVAYGFGAVALLLATAVSGFIVPDIMRHMARDAAANAPQWHMIIDAVFQFNQAFARIYSVAASAAILLWSASALRHGGLSRGIAIYGCIVAPALIVLIAVGHLRLNVHGMAVVVFAHALWFVIAGVELCRRPGHQTV